MSRERKTVKCPLCAKELTTRGLPGHMRFVHAQTAAGNPIAIETASVVKLHRELSELLELQSQVSEQLKEAGTEEMDDGLWGDSPSVKALKAVRKGYAKREDEILEELKVLVEDESEEEHQDTDPLGAKEDD